MKSKSEEQKDNMVNKDYGKPVKLDINDQLTLWTGKHNMWVKYCSDV